MPEDRPDCPFTLEAPTLPTVTSTPVPVVSAAPPTLSRMAPTPQAQTCLGESSAGALPFLREMLAQLEGAEGETRDKLLLAARFGLAALEGGEDIRP